MRALVFLLLIASATAAVRLPDACGRLDMPDVPALREECDAATRSHPTLQIPVDVYIAHDGHKSLNASRTKPAECEDKARIRECIAILSARTDAAVDRYRNASQAFARALVDWGDTFEKAVVHSIERGRRRRSPDTFLRFFLFVYLLGNIYHYW